MIKRIFFPGLFSLMVAQSHGLLAMQTPAVALSPDILSLQEEILRQGELAEAIVLSKQEELVATARDIPAAVVEGLNKFFGDPRAMRLFVDRCKSCKIAWPAQNRMRRDGGMRLGLLQANEAAYAERSGKVQVNSGEFEALYLGLVRDYGLVNLEQDGHNFVLTSPLWPGAVVKIAKYRWVDNDAMIAFPYQLISRVFYNMELNAFIGAHGYDRSIVRFPKSLYHIPGTSVDINDDNYVVVAPLLPCPNKLENGRRFKSMTVKELVEGHGEHAFVKKEYYDAVCDLVTVIQHCGLWCLSTSNVFLLDNGKIALVDTERPGLGGSEWRFFFHQGEGAAAEIARNAQGGWDGLTQDVLGTAPKPQ